MRFAHRSTSIASLNYISYWSTLIGDICSMDFDQAYSFGTLLPIRTISAVPHHQASVGRSRGITTYVACSMPLISDAGRTV